jgi:hypothetical protein
VNPVDSWADVVQDILDLVGVVDPTGVVDVVNAVGYALRGKWGSAAVTALGIIPYVGDVAKAGKAGHAVALATRGARQVAREGLQRVAQPRAALPPRVFLTQKRLEHIVERHWATSGHNTPPAGKFMAGMTARRLKEMIRIAAEGGTWQPARGRRLQIEYDFGHTIGVDWYRNPATRLRVIVEPDGEVVTAYPF